MKATWAKALAPAALLLVLLVVPLLGGCSDETATCGNDQVEAGEECDDGNVLDDDTCTSTCRRASCGDGIVQASVGEECDDGNVWSDDACTNTCRVAVCGDGVVQQSAGETCDDGNRDAHDGCTNACAAASCGDGVLRRGYEACDDGNADDGDGCSPTCQLGRCGDGVVQPGEACDDGNSLATDDCLPTCVAPACGDGVTWKGQEACDDGNADDHDACTNTCAVARCGDGIVQAGVEPCDGSTDCTAACRLASCGDGAVQAPEACDDGNASTSDDCTPDCLAARCGDGVVHVGTEACDDGNANDHDTCLGACTVARCGDGVVLAGVEACDDGNDDDSDACGNDCALPTCGDGVKQPGEACDDGNASSADACLPTCVLASCGDGAVQPGEACDDGNASSYDDCTTACVAARCGDGLLHVGVEACDDGNGDGTDGCTTACALATCGNGVRDPGEACDDGNTNATDDCLPACVVARCGDGAVHDGVEACDDGNGVDEDGCTNACGEAGCGDGVVGPGELCDDGNGSDTDACLTSCLPARCGDGRVHKGVEACDDGNHTDDDACLSTCEAARCGDGVRWPLVEACDDGNAIETDGCRSDCTSPRCGDGIVQVGKEQCDDQNTDNTDGCLLTCATFDWCDGFGLSAITPAVACQGAVPSSLRLTGDGRGFVFIDGKAPTITVAGSPVTITNKLDCGPIAGGFVTAEGCGRLDVNIAPLSLGVGDFDVVVTNPVSAPCADHAVFSVGPPPHITSVEPAALCADLEVTVTIRGTGLVASTIVTAIGPGGVQVGAASTALVEPGRLDATFAALTAGTWAIRVSNGASCDDQKNAAFEVYPRPVVFFVDPPVIYNGVDVQASVYVANINGGAVSEVAVRRVGTSSWLPIAHTFDPSRPFRVQTTVPHDLITAGELADFEFTLTDGLGCPASLTGVAGFTKVVSVAPFGISPPFGGQTSPTGVTVDIAPSATGVLFQEIPRVYLNPIAGGGIATPLTSLGFLNGRSLSALVPGSLPVGDYQVIVVNPDGTVGISTPPIPGGGFRVTAATPPQIRAIAPGSIPGASTVVKVFGSGFVSPVVRLECALAGSTTTQLYGTANVALRSYGLDFTLDSAASPPQDSVCVVRVTSQDGSYAEYSALVVLNSAENIPPAEDTKRPMLVPRRAPATPVGAVSSTSRFLYAIGGDSGTTASALASIEVTPLTPFGTLAGAWRTLSAPLPAPRTTAQAVSVGRFIYLVGGDSGSGPITSTLRAEVLQPSDSPEFDGNLEIGLNAAGLGPGLWYYQVSAVMGASDADNPGGETLPSEPLPVVVPTWAPSGFRVTLRWSAVAGAASYVIYRSPVAGGSLSSVRRITTVTAPTTSYTDTKGPSDPLISPRALGDLGTWKTLPALPGARAGFGLAVARDPAVATRQYLYALGGRASGATSNGSFDYLQLDTTATGSQDVALAWTSGGANTVPARQDHGIWAVDIGVVSPPGVANEDDAWVFVGPGTGAANANRIYSAQVKTGGALGTFALAFNGNASRTGYGAVAISSQLFLLGGRQSGSISASRDSSLITGLGTISNVNATPGNLILAREFPGTALGSGRIFLVGGMTPTGATAAVESSPW